MCDPETTHALGQITQQLGEIRADQIEHGKTLATLEERSEQHEKRMDRTERKSLLSGGGAGAAIAGVFIALKTWFGGV